MEYPLWSIVYARKQTADTNHDLQPPPHLTRHEMTAIHRLDSSRHTKTRAVHYVKPQANPPSQSPKVGETSRLYAMLPIIQGVDQNFFCVC